MALGARRGRGGHGGWRGQLPPDLIDDFRCPLCPNCFEIFSRNSDALKRHKDGLDHKYNYFIDLLKNHRKRKVKDRHGVKVITTCDTHDVMYKVKDGTVKSKISTEQSEILYKFEVVNSSAFPVKLCDVFLLHPYVVFRIMEGENFNDTNRRPEILPNASCEASVSCKSETVGSYGVPVVFTFLLQKPGKPDKYFDIIRFMIINVVGLESFDKNPYKSPFIGDKWIDIQFTVYGIRENGRLLRRLTDFKLSPDYQEMFNHWMTPWPRMSDESCILLGILMSLSRDGYKSLKDYYKEFFHTLLYLEEYDSTKALENYNMSGVVLVLIHEPDQFQLQVPGLAEKRPSVLRGDLIYVRIRFPDDTLEPIEYEGCVIDVQDTHVHISGFNPEFLGRFNMEKDLKFDVHFTFSRYPIVVMHKAVDLVVQNNLLNVLFPSGNLPQRALIDLPEKLQLFNTDIGSNVEQVNAVRNILTGVCRPSPYIIFGPPGTGKSVTIVEAILQIKKLFKSSHILVCAPSNAACDFLTEKLAKFCRTSELLRLHSSSRDWKNVPKAIHDYSNRRESLYFVPDAEKMLTYRIIVCTLITANRLVYILKDQPGPYITHVFIDECGQALEPESLAAIGDILGPVNQKKIGGHLILAGDPKQLGPVCSSYRAEYMKPRKERFDEQVYTDQLAFLNSRIGLGVSLLERLMITCELYQKSEDGLYDSCYITKLLQNYRSHPTILKLPNQLFYGNELIYKCPDDILKDPLLELPLFRKKKGHSVIFHGVMGHERREGCSPSYFNTHEILQVIEYLEKLLSSGKVKAEEIGIIAPYIRQVYKLKRKLEDKKWDDVEVGTTEVFQGREKRVIIISTVRANRNLLDEDQKFQIGFLSNAKRFNVAITRAQSLLIVIGNPFMIGSDDNWLALMEYSQQIGSYVGCPFQKRDIEWKNNVVQKLSRLDNND